MARYIPSWREIDILAKAGDIETAAYNRGDYATARRLQNLIDRIRSGERGLTEHLDNLAIDTYNRIYGSD